MESLHQRHVEDKPYKGSDSYQQEDSEFFFGRDRDAGELMARVLSSRFTLLHAPSGAGKTSLLNAWLIPELEKRGWLPIRALPERSPSRAVRVATLLNVVPFPHAEAFAVEQVLRSSPELGENPTIEQTLEFYDQLAVRDARRRQWLAPVTAKLPIWGATGAEMGWVTPHFSRLLRASIDFGVFAERIAALTNHVADESQSQLSIDPAMSLRELQAPLAAPTLTETHAALVGELDIPVPGLRAFFEHLFSEWGQWLSSFSLVIILDQFEELCTRFVDRAHLSGGRSIKGLPDWRLRRTFLEELEDLYLRATMPPVSITDDTEERDRGKRQLPIRYVVSMRDEYIAKMDDIRRFVWDLDDSSYHLTFIDKEYAKQIIKQPAAMYGYTYSDDCFAEMVSKLTTEERVIEPAHIQIVCEKLWNIYGHVFSVHQPIDMIDAPLPEIGIDRFHQVGGADGILASYFTEFLDNFDEPDRVEILEMLEPLITSTGTRNIVERSELVSAPLRDPGHSEELLKQLQDNRIVRVEGRLGAYFAEITHEFLISSMLDAIEEYLIRNREYRYLRQAVRGLQRLKHVDFRELANTKLALEELQSLHEHRTGLSWPSWGAEVMFRNMVLHDAGHEAIADWRTRYEELSQDFDVSDVLTDLKMRKEHDWKLDMTELRLLHKEEAQAQLDPEDLEFVLRSVLTYATDRDGKEIWYWVSRITTQ